MSNLVNGESPEVKEKVNAFEINKTYQSVGTKSGFQLFENGQRVYSPSNKPTAKDVGAVAPGDFGVGSKQGSGAMAEKYTEGGALDFNKLLTAGEFSTSGNWLNGVNNVGNTAQSHNGIVKVEVRNTGTSAGYVQTYKWASGGTFATKTRTGSGTHPNITWTPWLFFGPSEIESQYRICIDRPGMDVYPYMTLNKTDMRTNVTSGWYNSGSVQFKTGPKSDNNNPDSGQLNALITNHRRWDNKQNRLLIQLRKAEGAATSSEVALYEDGVNLLVGGKSARYDGTDWLIDNKKAYHEGFKPALEDLGITGKSMGFSKSLGTDDLDTVKTSGVYFQDSNSNATTARHYPVNLAGSLVVYRAAGCIQEYRVYNRAETWTRAQYSSGGWTTWAKTYNTLVKPTAKDVGALPTTGGTLTGIVSAPEVQIGTNAGLKFSPNSDLRGFSWGVGMNDADGVFGIHKYQEGLWQNQPLFIDTNSTTNLVRANIGAGLRVSGLTAAYWGEDSGHHGGIGPTSSDNLVDVALGHWYPMLTSPKYVLPGVGYTSRWQLGHFRPETNRNGEFAISMTGDGYLTEGVRFGFNDLGMLTGTGRQGGGYWTAHSNGFDCSRIGTNIIDWCMSSFATLSDKALKRNIKPATKSALDDVAKIDFVSYDWKEEALTKDFKSTKLGVTAQQMEEIDPCYTRDIETFNPDGSVETSVKSLDVTNMLALALKANQELLARIKALEAKLN